MPGIWQTSAKAIPYGQFSLVREFGSPVDNGTGLNFEGGVKLFFGDGGGALIPSLFYNRILHDEDEIGFSALNVFGFAISVAVYFP